VAEQKSDIKNQTCGIPASRDDFINSTFCILIFALTNASFRFVRPLSRGLQKKTAVPTKETAALNRPTQA
jgi:hypothetical protein